MQIVNSLKNKNVKKYIIVSLITVIIIAVINYAILISAQQDNIEKVLTKYEVLNLSESLALEEIYSQTYNLFYIFITITIALSLLIVLYFFIALNKNEKDTKNIRKYLEEIANRNYKFDIENMSESEMSNLKTEIYKIVLELKERAENLAKDRETLSNYLADISHQLRTPLMIISSMVYAKIENEDKLDEKTRKFIYEISKQLDQINWLVDNLLKMAQLDTKTVIFNKENIKVKSLVEKVKNNMSIFLELKNQKMVLDIDEKIKINVDIKWMTEAIENIVKNCIEHSGKNSLIEISADQNPLYTQIEIRDYGKGIKPKDLPRVFDKFYKGENANHNSFGIGLSLAKSIIESQNGEIIVHSKEKVGTTFTIKLYNKI